MPPGSRRPDRVAEAIREEVATFLAESVKDPRAKKIPVLAPVSMSVRPSGTWFPGTHDDDGK